VGHVRAVSSMGIAGQVAFIGMDARKTKNIVHCFLVGQNRLWAEWDVVSKHKSQLIINYQKYACKI
jgi:hypothetical protein